MTSKKTKPVEDGPAESAPSATPAPRHNPRPKKVRVIRSIGRIDSSLDLEIFMPGKRAKKTEGVVCYFALQAGPLRVISGRLMENADGVRYVIGPCLQRKLHGRLAWVHLWSLDPTTARAVQTGIENLLKQALDPTPDTIEQETGVDSRA